VWNLIYRQLRAVRDTAVPTRNPPLRPVLCCISVGGGGGGGVRTIRTHPAVCRGDDSQREKWRR